MKHHYFSRVLAGILCFLMVLSVVPMTALAAIDNYNKDYQTDTHTVFKHTEQTLAPGVTNYTNYAYSSDGKQMVYYVTTADISRDDVVCQVAYKDMQCETFGMSKLTDIVKVANAKYTDPENPAFISEYYTVVSGINGNGYNMTTGQPSGVWAMGGKIAQDYTGGSAFFAILKDGTAVMGKTVQEWNDYKNGVGVEEAINAFGTILVWDGADVTASASGSYNTDRHSRTMLGLTEDGKVVTAVLDGRQEPFSCGGTMHELAQIMLEAGCKYAINLDGGGSSTFVTRNEGENEVTILNRPSDGSERAISNGMIIASLAAPSDVFDHVTYAPENDYLVPGASVALNVSGVSPAGTAAQLPEDITYSATYGVVENGIYVAGDTAGSDTVVAYYNGVAVGSVEINVVIPDSVSVAGNALSCPYGKVADIVITLTKDDKNGIAHEVTYLPENLEYSISDPSFGTVDVAKMSFTATDQVLDVTTGTLTVSLAGHSDVYVTVPLQVGKGTSTVFDWEDGQLGNFDCFDYYNSGVQYDLELVDRNTGKVHSGDYAMKFALDFSQVTYYEDYMDVMVQYNSEAIRAHGDTVDEDGAKMAGLKEDYIDITGACGIGFWVYIPDEIDVNGIDPRFFFGYKKSKTDTTWTRGTSPMVLWVQDREFPTDNWYYYYADLSAYSSYYAMTLQNSRPLASNGTTKNGQKGYPYHYYAGAMFEFYVNDRAWKTYNVQSYNSNFTLYIDDFMVDYSSVIPDRVAPEFGNATYAYTGLSDAAVLENGSVIRGYDIDLGVSVTDPTTFKVTKGVKTWTTKSTPASGIDAATAKILIDGNEMPATYKNGKLTLDRAVILADGTHIVKFEIADKQGNVQTLVRTFVVESGNSYETISVVPHNTELTSTLCGSLYYIDVNATDISKVQKVTTTLKVNNVNNWELQGMIVADGFEVATSTELGDAGEVTLTITRVGEVTQTGPQTLVSVPVRAWYPHNALGWDSATLISKNRVYSMDIQLVTKTGLVEYVDGFEQACVGAFSSPLIQINNESQTPAGKIGIVSPTGTTSWHTHSAVSVESKAATCTEDGFTGRTYCEVCDSVVDFGTVIPATGHTYDIIDGIRKCTECSELFSGEFEGVVYVDGIPASGWSGDSYYENGVMLTGVKEIDGYYYDFGENGICEGKIKYTGKFYNEELSGYSYSKIGVLSSGWFEVDGAWNYFSGVTFVAITGEYTFKSSGITFVFDNEGNLTKGTWVTTEEGTRYYYGPTYYNWVNNILQEIDGETYCFDKDGYLYRGYQLLQVGFNQPTYLYHFDEETGALIEIISDYTGLVTTDKGIIYLINGQLERGHRLYTIDGHRYFITWEGKAVVGQYALSATDEYNAGTYTFDKTGKLNETKEFIEEDGELHYYFGGVKQSGLGLVTVDGSQYYINGKGIVATGRYYIYNGYKGCSALATGYYNFGTDGKLVGPVTGHEFINENGELHYYIDGVKQSGLGLVTVDGSQYYINTKGIVATGRYYIHSGYKGCGALATGYYNFGTDGKLVGPAVDIHEIKTDDDGVLRYYINGVKQSGLGLITVNGSQYYINTRGIVATGIYYIHTAYKGCSALTTGYYDFGTDGKLVGPVTGHEFINENGELHYYIDGVKQSGLGLITVDGSQYYINTKGIVATGRYYIHSGYKGCGALATGYYNFGTDGKLVGPVVDSHEIKTDDDGVLRYYINGVMQSGLGLITVDGSQYYINTKGIVATGIYYIHTAYKGCSSLATGYYDFGTDGKLVK